MIDPHPSSERQHHPEALLLEVLQQFLEDLRRQFQETEREVIAIKAPAKRRQVQRAWSRPHPNLVVSLLEECRS